MRHSTYQSIYKPVSPASVQWSTGELRKKWLQLKTRPLLLKIAIISLIVIIGCSTMLTAFAGGEEDLLSGRKVIVSQGDTLWNLSVEYKPQQMDTRVFVEVLKKINKLSSNSIQAGQVLILPQYDDK
ncbi:LysM peptidoglycan-binding domain-containing protein [Paenibacillus xylanexedens]|uniref:LysM peptidoglycan-binding domain-containing protein n=1 Tax=Paenibacillus xylanexedens TaxID=528191 RepID=UPI0011A537BA|nr:LysM peptidoglycan-binding domain-containing protein [Paenibacillus xylanexedens]